MTDSQPTADRSLFTLAQIQHLMRVEFNRAQRYEYPIVCMLIAVDRLGHLRDLYGFDAKEEILEGVVGLLKAGTRSSDFLGRMADDRLLAVVPHTDAAGAQVLAQRLVEGARALSFAADDRSRRRRTQSLECARSRALSGPESEPSSAEAPCLPRIPLFQPLEWSP